MCHLVKLSTTHTKQQPAVLSLSHQVKGAPFFMRISKEQLQELTELIEDSVAHHCDQNMSSGEMVWTVVECLATAKLEELTHA